MKKYTLKQVMKSLKGFLLLKKSDLEKITECKVLIRKEYDFDKLSAYEVVNSIEEGDKINLTLYKKNIAGKVRLCVEKNESNYRFVQLIDNKAMQVFKKNEILFAYDKLGE